MSLPKPTADRRPGQPRVLVVEDDAFVLDFLLRELRGAGERILTTGSRTAAGAVEAVADPNRVIDAVVIDLGLESCAADAAALTGVVPSAGDPLGLTLARRLRQLHPSLPLYGIAREGAREGDHAQSWFRDNGYPRRAVGVYHKSQQLALLKYHLFEAVGLSGHQEVILVHGHAERRLKEFEALARTLGFIPVVLGREQRRGQGWIDLFEQHADRVSLAWVLFTPDEWAAGIERPELAPERRARPNVVLELGYLFGRFGRHSRRVFLFRCDEVTLPSDISGLAHIEVAGPPTSRETLETIRRELALWLPVSESASV